MKPAVLLLCCLILSTAVSAEKIDPEPIIVQLSEAGYICRLDEAKIAVQKKGNLNFEIYAEDKGLILRAHFPLSDKIKTEEARFHKLINKINSECKCAKYYSKDGKLFVEAFYPLPYVKKTFFFFMSAWEEDFTVMMKNNSSALAEFAQ